MACNLSDYFNPHSALQNEAKGFCQYRTARDLIMSYSERSLHDLLAESFDDDFELMIHSEEIERYSLHLIERLKANELYEECDMVKKKTEFYLDQIQSINEGL